MTVTLADIVAARARISGAVMNTPCSLSPGLSEICGCTIYTKLEYMQETGSFKERGACNAMMLLSPEQRSRGVTAASAGNHALALAYHGRRLDIPVTVVMPMQAPLIKRTRCAAMGAKVILHGDNVGEAKVRAEVLVAEHGLTYIHGFDGAEVIAGQGTIGLELLDQLADVEAIVCPIGGGGLIAGLALAVKSLKPSVHIVGVEPEHCRSYLASLEAGKPVKVQVTPTLADGLAVPQVGSRAFAIARPLVDEVVAVGERELALAILRLVEVEKGVVEGAGAAPLAAFLSGQLSHLRGKRVVLVLCGGNIDPAVLGRVIEYGLVIDGRLARFTAVISDRPGGLADLASAIASCGASIKQVEHERAFGSADVSRVQVLCTIETRDAAHIEEVQRTLREHGIEIIARY